MKNRQILKIFTTFIVLGIVVSFWVLDLGRFFTLEQLKSSRDALARFYDNHPAQLIGAYAGIYILATALSLPGAAILTLGGGAIFGFWAGTAIVSFASTIGATAAFLVSRFLLRDFVQDRFGEKLKTINEGIRREGAFYLFTLRLIPIFPFFLINLVMGLTSMPARSFFIVSQIGMLAGTAAFVNAGTQLGHLESLSGILSWNLLAAFAVLGILPLISKAAIQFFRSRRVLRKFKRPSSFDYNIVVIGAGSAGLVSCYIAAAVKAKVALIEKQKMGGDCLNTGCVPSKALIRSAKILSYIRRAKEYGFKEMRPEFDFAEVMDRVQRVIRTVEPHDSVERYSDLGVNCIQGDAKILSPYEVQVGLRKITTRNIIIATGAGPLVPPIPGLDKIPYLTSDTVWNLRKLPKRLLVLGGGPIGCELAQAFSRFGAEIDLVEMAPRIMFREDPEVSAHVQNRFQAEGIRVHAGTKAKAFAVESGKKILLCEREGKEVRIEFDEALLALGRKAHVRGFGLEELGVAISDRGTIAHDEFLRTNFPNIYVCGDVAGPYQFTHTAAHQAWYAAVNALFSPLKKFRVDYRVIPWCTFTDPEVARVGLNEQEAEEKKIPYEVSRYGIDDLDRAIAEEEAHGFIKVLTPPGKDRVLGVTIVGSHAGDIIAEYVAAMKHGFGLNKILGTIHIYPTLAEANKYAAGVWKRQNAPARSLAFLKRFHAWRRGGKGVA